MSVDVTDLLTKAWKAVQDSKIPEPLHELALGRAIDILSGSEAPKRNRQDDTSTEENPGNGPSNTSDGATSGQTSDSPASEDEFYDRMSKGTGVSIDLLERLVHIHDNAPHVVLKTGALPKENSAAQKLITLLITVATHYWTGDPEVDLALARAECEQFNRADSNFAKNVDRIENIVITGAKGGNKRVKIRRAYLDSFKAEVLKYGQFAE